MSTDCFALSVSIKGGSSVCIQECGGIQLKSGDILLVKAPLAAALSLRYKENLSEPIACEIDGRLRFSHYDYRRLRLVLKPKHKAIIMDKMIIEIPNATETKEEKEGLVEVNMSMKDLADNCSMDSDKGKKKRRTRKAKRKEDE